MPPRNGYISDVEYPRHFHRETMPVWLVSVLSALGRRTPDLAQPYTWLELGCGTGLGAAVAAATNPQGRFIGIDADVQAIAAARALAHAAGIANAEFHCLSFDEAAAAQELLPPCDFIVAHGVYSWVGPADRQAMRRLAAHRLKPGGVLYVSYMSQPGAGVFAAAQRLMRLGTRRTHGTSADKARAGRALLRRLANAGAGYFSEHPSALRELGQMEQSGADYLAHEYLNAFRDALHGADVMAEFGEANCEYAGSATPFENIDAVSLPGATQTLLAKLRNDGADVAEIETFKDIVRNQNLRRDIYQRRPTHGASLLPPDAHRAALLAQRVGLLPAAPLQRAGRRGELVFDTRIGPVRLAASHAAPLLDALENGPCSYAELARLPAYVGQPGFVSQLLQMLAWAGWLHFARPAPSSAPTGPADAPGRLLRALAGLPAPAGGAIVPSQAIGSAWPVPADALSPPRRGLHWLELPS